MIFDLICQVTPPDADLSGVWAKFIIGGLASFILILLGAFVKVFLRFEAITKESFAKVDSISDQAFKKVDVVVGEFKDMHKEATNKLSKIDETLQNQNTKLEVIQVHMKETKHALQSIDCVQEDSKPKRKVS